MVDKMVNCEMMMVDCEMVDCEINEMGDYETAIIFISLIFQCRLWGNLQIKGMKTALKVR